MGDLDLDYVRMLWLLLEVCVVGNYLTLLLIGLSLIIISHCRVLGASCSRLPRPNTRLCIIHRGQIYMTTCIKLNSGNLKEGSLNSEFYFVFGISIVREIEMSCENN